MLRFRCQFRRIVLTAALYTLALLIFDRLRPGPADGPLFAVVLFALMLIVAAATAALFAHLMPGWLRGMEASGQAAVVWAWLVAHAGLSLPVWAENVLFVALSMGFALLLYGRQWQRFAGDTRPFRLRFDTGLPPALVWRRLFPDPAAIAHHIYPGARIKALPSGDFRLDYPRRSSPTGRLEEVVRVEISEPPHHFRLKSFAGRQGLEATGLTVGEAMETQEVWLSLLPGGGTRVQMAVTVHAAPPGFRLFAWLSDLRRDIAAHFHSRIEGRPDRSLSGRGYGPPVPFPAE